MRTNVPKLKSYVTPDLKLQVEAALTRETFKHKISQFAFITFLVDKYPGQLNLTLTSHIYDLYA